MWTHAEPVLGACANARMLSSACLLYVQIFLAIIVDSYGHVKEHTVSSQGLAGEVSQVAFHGLKRRVVSKKTFLSNQDLLHSLMQLKVQLEKDVKKGGRREINKIRGPKERVLVPGGAEINPLALARMLLQAQAIPDVVCVCC
jgi:hypothetical protein